MLDQSGRLRLSFIALLILLAASLACSFPGGSGPSSAGEGQKEEAPDDLVKTPPTEEEAAVAPAEPTATSTPTLSARAITASNAADLVILNTREVSRTVLLGAAASPIAGEFATYGYDKTIRLWTYEDPAARFETQPTSDFGFGLAYSPDGTRIAATGGFHVYIYDAASGQRLHDVIVNSRAFRVTWSPDGSRLAVVGSGSSKIEFIDTAAGKLVDEERLNNPTDRVLWAVAYAPDGQTVATADDRGKIYVLQLDGQRVFEDSDTSRGATWDLEFSPDGSLLASCNANGGVFVYDTGDWSLVMTHEQPFAGGCTDGVFSVGGDVYFAAGANGHLRGWDLFGGGVTIIDLAFPKQVWMIGLSGDGEFIVAAVDNGMVGIVGLPKD